MADVTEVLVAETIDCFESLPLQDLDDQWINDLWFNQFSSLEEYPSSGNSIFVEGLFEPILKAINLCEKWIEKSSASSPSEADSIDDDERDAVLWTVLLDNDIDIKFILGFLYAVCNISIKPDAQMYEKEMGLKCAKLYFTLLRIPGNMAYSVYHPSLFYLAFDCFKFPKERVPGKKRPPTSAYRNDIVSKRKRTRRDDEDSFSESPEEPLGIEDVDIPDEREFNQQECSDVLIHIVDVLKSVIPLFQTFSLNNNFELIEHIARKLSECVAVENRHTDLNFSRGVDDICSFQHRNGISYVITALGYCAYLGLCQTLHGDVQEIYRLCVQSLCAHILCLKAKSQPNQVITHKHIVVKDNALAFVCYNLNKRMQCSPEISRILIQRLCIRCCDKTDYRSKVASGILSVLKNFPLKAYVEIVDWFVRFATQKPQDKLIILDIFSLLIAEPEKKVTPEITEKWAIYATHVPIVFSIIERCNDKAPTVRAKALNVLTIALKRIIDVIKQDSRNHLSPSEEDEENEEEVDDHANPDIVSEGAENMNAANTEAAVDENAADRDGESEPANPEAVQGPVEKQIKERKPCLLYFKICTIEKLVDLLILRSMDFKVHVRKAALQAIESLLYLDEAYVTEKFLTFLSRGTRDPNVTVRKSSISSLTVILHKYYNNTLVQKFWLKSVLPVVLDAEKSVQSKSLEEMEPLFLLNYGGSSALKDCTWTMLNEIACGGHNDLLRYLQKAYGIWNSEGKLRDNLSTILENELGYEHDSAVWMLLSILSSNIKIRNITMIINRWEQSWEEEVENSARLRMLQVLGHACKHMKADQLKGLQATLENQIRSFNCHFQLISTTMEVLYKIYRAQSKGEDATERLMNNFADEVMQVLMAKFHSIEREICTMLFNGEKCPTQMFLSEAPQPTGNFLSELVMEKDPSEKYSEDMICQFLYTLGEIALLAPGSIPKNMVLILQSIIASTSESDNSINRGPSTSDDKSTKVWRPSPKIQAFSFLTLGKLCLTNEEYPESCLPVFIRELATSKSFIVRMNIVTALADLCVRYTLMVDLYIPSISVCLKDVSVNIRCQTLALISRLLQEDYIKLKDSLLYRLLSVLVDPDEDMRNMVEYCLGSLLVKRHPTVFVQHFVETIFYFNSCSSVPSLRANQLEPDIKLFSLKGKKNFEKRNTIYKFITKHTPAVRKLQIVTKLTEDILNAVVNQTISLDDSVEAVIKDCLVVLSSDEIKPSQCQSNSGDDNDESESTDSIGCKTVYRNTVVTAIIPIAVALKKTLLDAKSPLVNTVLQFIGEICKDYKNEVKDSFASNKVIIEEIEFITKKYEKEHEKKQAHNKNRETEVNPDLPRTDDRGEHNSPLNQSIVNNEVGPRLSPVVVLTRLPIEQGQTIDVSRLMIELNDSRASSLRHSQNNQHQTSLRRVAQNGRMPLAETEEILSQEANERNIANGNITVCDIGNSEWDDTRRSLHGFRTHRSGNDEN